MNRINDQARQLLDDCPSGDVANPLDKADAVGGQSMLADDHECLVEQMLVSRDSGPVRFFRFGEDLVSYECNEDVCTTLCGGQQLGDHALPLVAAASLTREVS